ncbi:MAG: anthranilate synthase component I [Rhodobiaceae bacterium]|nr:anthranilate synthase component I [Rhodobiaceae bacterium]MCC0013108.1 anthranilate synthase component I [Rhodobiaceae bacterium]MCC0062305.1 anthranilate synthase component I [Rhodobiaceae bacterium]
MNIEPSFPGFQAAYDDGTPQVVWTRLVADLETPVSAMLKLSAGREKCFLLESVEGGAVRGRYSIIGLSPDLVFRANGNDAQINDQALTDPDTFKSCGEPTLSALRTLIAQSRIDLPESLPPMAAGIFGYLGYDTVRLMEDLPATNPDRLGTPDAILVRPTIVVIFDAVRDEITVVTPVRKKDGVSANAAYSRAIDRLNSVVDGLDTPLDKSAVTEEDVTANTGEPVSNTTPAEYMEMVAKAKDYIGAGDIFQVVLSQRFEAPFSLPPFALYRALRRVNPAPFLYFLDFDDFAVVGSSPEILVRVRAGKVTIRPIAGTRPRGATHAEDRRLAEELLADPKELAEHLMLLDLGRNDVGRVSKIGTVNVTDRFFLEYYSQVMHIVSNVEGALDDSRDAIDALVAGFPAGTVSGAPKVRAMEIIDELEKDKRGIYAGAIGYFSADGEMDTCIILRTSIVRDGKMYVQAGAGIVADSVPESEQAECVNKAKALFRAAEEAVRFASSAGRGQ